MSMKNMDFDMKVGERLKVGEGVVRVDQVDGGVRYYSLKGKMLNRFSKEQIEERSKPKLILMRDCILTQKDNYRYVVLTYIGAEICEFEATNIETYKNYVIVENNKEMRLYDTEKRKFIKFIGETFDEIWRWGEYFILKKDGMHYLYNVESKSIEEKFEICIVAEYTRRKRFIILYHKNKCGLWVLERYDRSFSKVLPIEYQKIQVKDDEILAIKNGKKEHYHLEKSYCKKKIYNPDHVSRRIKMQSDYKIKFLNSILVAFGEEMTLNEKFILVSGDFKEKRPYKYYTLHGKYIGNSGIIKNEFDEFCGENYIATENMLALGGNQSIPFGPTSKEWKIYDYEGNKLFEEDLEFQKLGRGEYFLGTPSDEEDISYIFSDKGEMLFPLNNLMEVFSINDKYCEMLNTENEIWFLDNKGKAIFNRGIEYDRMVRLNNGFAGEKIEDGYNLYNWIKGKVYYILADSIKNIDTYSSCMQEAFIKVTYKEKQGVILLNDEGYKVLIPIEYLKVEQREEFFITEAEEWDDIYDLKGTLIMSTK